MIIKKINIIAFGGLKNKVLELNEGINIIYGENEAGKSTIQSFIKVWLYGFSSYRGKDYRNNERLRYSPINGDKISGELYIEHKNKEYIIKRVFGKTKKEDSCIVIDAITGNAANEISSDEPGKSLLGINRATFLNTLFIGQLAVNVKRNKDEEILDKIVNLVSENEEESSIDSSFLKIERYRKSISNNRKSGEYDLLTQKYSSLLKERYEAYELSENNLKNEENIIKLKEARKYLNLKLISLDEYKKYLKKIKLKKEYEEINNYFLRKQELENEEKNIIKSLKFNDKIIDKKIIDNIKEEYFIYLRLLDTKKKQEEEMKMKEDNLRKAKEPFKQYDYINKFDEDIVNRLEKLKIQKDILGEKVNIKKKIDSEISYLENKESEARKIVRNLKKIEEIKPEIESTLKEYKNKLVELKTSIEENKKVKINVLSDKGLICIVIFALIIGLIIKNIVLSLSLYIIAMVTFSLYVYKVYSSNNNNKKINNLKKSIDDLEKQLNSYMSIIGVESYEELLKNLTIYNDYLSIQEKINERILENIRQKELLDLDKALINYNENEIEIKKYLEIANAKNIDKLINTINNYKKIEKDFVAMEIEIKNLATSLNNTVNELNLKQKKIAEELSLIGIKNNNINNTGQVILDLEEKIVLKDEIDKKLASVEEAYLALTKDKDIELIKEEMLDIIHNNDNYDYKNEEEVDKAIRDKNKELIDIEKQIKDIENEVNTRFKGKRNIPEIEEEIEETNRKIIRLKKQLEASIIANNILKEAYDELRGGIGEVLNDKVIEGFKELTYEKYNKVMVDDNYEMMVKDENNMLRSEFLSNGANDQLYLALRLAFIEMIFKLKDLAIYLDDTFIQYDDKRLDRALKHLIKLNIKQILIFTCQNREIEILNRENVKYKYNELMK